MAVREHACGNANLVEHEVSAACSAIPSARRLPLCANAARRFLPRSLLCSESRVEVRDLREESAVFDPSSDRNARPLSYHVERHVTRHRNEALRLGATKVDGPVCDAELRLHRTVNFS